MHDKPNINALYKILKTEKAHRIVYQQRYNWHQHARPDQLPPPGDWKIWLLLAGRGFGKTRTGAETLRAWIHSGQCRRIALVAETEIECRQVMIEGNSGLLAIHPSYDRPQYEPSNRQVTWSNGAIAHCYSAEAYEHLRGPQFDAAWIDELAKFKEGEKVLDQLMFALRLGTNPRLIITTTPRPTPLIKKLLKSPSLFVTRGSTFDNIKNLSPSFINAIKETYECTMLGRQELYAEIVEDRLGALWTHQMIETAKTNYQAVELRRIVVAIDPAVSHGSKSDETGIIVAGLTNVGMGIVLEDLSLKGPPSVWIQKAIGAYHQYKADRMVAEVNMGGELVEHLLRTYDYTVSYKAVHALRGKHIRAEPIAALYERGRVMHAPHLNKLEEQMYNYIPGESKQSPDRLDALVWALTELMLKPLSTPGINLC